MSERRAVVDTVHALTSATAGGRPLPGPAYAFVFPVLCAVLSWPVHTPLHEEALAVLALHVAPGDPLPRAAMLALLFHVLELMPAYRRAAPAGPRRRGATPCMRLRVGAARLVTQPHHAELALAQGQGAAAARRPVRGPERGGAAGGPGRPAGGGAARARSGHRRALQRPVPGGWCARAPCRASLERGGCAQHEAGRRGGAGLAGRRGRAVGRSARRGRRKRHGGAAAVGRGGRGLDARVCGAGAGPPAARARRRARGRGGGPRGRHTGGAAGLAPRHARRLHEIRRSPGPPQEHPDTAGDVLRGILRTFAEAAGVSARSGAALALAACAAHTSARDVPHALDFLLGQAVADPSDVVRAQMLDAGARSTPAPRGPRRCAVRICAVQRLAPCRAPLTPCVVLLSRRRAGGRARRRRGQERHAAAV